MFRSILVALALMFSCLVAAAQPSSQDAVNPDGGLTEPVTDSELRNPAPALPASGSPAVLSAEEQGSDFSGILTTIKDTIIAILTAVLTGALGWLAARVAAWTGGKIRLDEVIRDNQMDQYAKSAVEKAFTFALTRVGVNWDQLQNVQIKNQVLRQATDFLLSQYPEVVKWVDKDQNGVIDWVETMMPSWVLLPVPEAKAVQASLGFSELPSSHASSPDSRRTVKRAGIKPAKIKPGPLDIPPLPTDPAGQAA
jgi:hypothetical protein